MKSAIKLDLESVIDSRRVSRFQIIIMALCALVAMMDGFDTQSIAFVAPEIVTAWRIAPSAFGPVFGSGLLGGLIGAILFGGAGDRFGRKPTLLLAVLLFSIGSLVTPFAMSIPSLIAVRFITGLGLGGALPSFISLTSEYAPKRARSTLVGLMFCGFPLGAVIGGFASAKLIPSFGWASVFVAGGVLPMLVIPFFMAFVPESVRFLALKRDHPAIASVLRRMDCIDVWNGELPKLSHQSRAPIANLFKEGRAVGTLLLWTTLFLSLLMTYFLVNWIPVVARQSGLGIESAVRAVSMMNLGAFAGCMVLGWLADRFGTARIIGCAFTLGAVAIGLIGHAGGALGLLYTFTFVAGFFSIGAQMCTVALCANFYETFLRATGLGWSMGISRIGAIAGPVLGGVLLGAGVTAPTLFIVAGVISLGAAIMIFMIGHYVLRARASLADLPSKGISNDQLHRPAGY